jgi:hypothetical protein
MKIIALTILFLFLSANIQAKEPEFSRLSSSDEPCSKINKRLPCPTSSGNQQTASLVLDVNGDGINDFVIADRSTTPSVVWFERSNTGWVRHIIDDNPLRIEAGGDFFDIDGDGDLDISFGGDNSSNRVWWWENPSPDFNTPWVRRIIKNDGLEKHHDQKFGDFNGDGKIELAFWNQKDKKLFLAEIPDNPKSDQPWPKKVIFSAKNARFEGISTADVDGDGISDLVTAGRWFKYQKNNTFQVNIIDRSMSFTRSAVGQIIKGGWAETVFVCGDCDGPLKMFENKNGIWQGKTLIPEVLHGHSLHLADMNDDGDLDIFVAEMRLKGRNPGARIRILYGDGAGNFQKQEIGIGTGNHESRVADLDGDGDIDILSKPYNWETPRIDVWLNNLSTSKNIAGSPLPLNKWKRHQIGTMESNGTHIVYGDFDGDEKIDIAAANSWFKNPGKLSKKWQKKTIEEPMRNVAIAKDFNGDGLVDLFGTAGIGSKANHTLVWSEQTPDGFKTYTNLGTGGTGDFLQGISFLQVTNQLLLSWHNGGGGVHGVQIPAETKSEEWPFSVLAKETQSEDLSVGDIDNDGDEDVLLGTKYLRNNNGTFEVVSIGTVSDLKANAMPDRNDLADINGDGKLDAIVALEKGTHLVWFEQIKPTKWKRHIITAELMGQGFSMDTADFDKDGDIDIVVGEHRGKPNNQVLIFENKNKGESWHQWIIDSGLANEIDHHDGTQAVDIDNDGDLDIISIGWRNKKVWVYENTSLSQ